jgi:hypothetical protein
MKEKNKSLIWMFPALFALSLSMSLNAQGDDLYYDPSTDSKPVPTPEYNYEESDNSAYQNGSDDQYYQEEEDYPYEYSSRIRRFHQPVAATDYYDPYFVDLYHYDPYYLPGASIYTSSYNDYWRWRQWQRWQRWNTYYPPYYGPGWGVGYSAWGCSAAPAYGAWQNPYVWNNYYYDPYWTWNGHNPYYYDNCAPGNHYFFYNNNNYYPNNNNNGGYQPQTYVGPRRGGTTVGSGSGGGYTRLTSGTGSNGRLLVMDDKTQVVDVKSQPTTTSRAVIAKEKEMARQEVERNVPAAANRKPATGGVKDPVAPQSGGRSQEVEKARPSRETVPTTTEPSRKPAAQQPAETRPSRPSSSGNENVRPSRPSSEDRPSRPSGSGNTETRPSRPSGSDSGSGKSWDTGSSGRSGSSNSGSSGKSGGDSGGGSKSSSGSSRGRN